MKTIMKYKINYWMLSLWIACAVMFTYGISILITNEVAGFLISMAYGSISMWIMNPIEYKRKHP